MSRVVLGVIITISSLLFLLQVRTSNWDKSPEDILQLVELLRSKSIYIGDAVPERCALGYQMQSLEEDRRPWLYKLSCSSEKKDISRMELEGLANKRIHKIGPIAVAHTKGCYYEGIKSFASTHIEPRLFNDDCWRVEREVSDGSATITCCSGEEKYIVNIDSQVSRREGVSIAEMNQGLFDLSQMRKSRGGIPEEMIKALYWQYIEARRLEFQSIKVDVSSRNATLIDGLLDPEGYKKLLKAYKDR